MPAIRRSCTSKLGMARKSEPAARSQAPLLRPLHKTKYHAAFRNSHTVQSLYCKLGKIAMIVFGISFLIITSKVKTTATSSIPKMFEIQPRHRKSLQSTFYASTGVINTSVHTRCKHAKSAEACHHRLSLTSSQKEKVLHFTQPRLNASAAT